MKLNAKQKLNATVAHVKKHPALYAAGLALAASAIAQHVYDTKKGKIYLDDLVESMKRTGKGTYFRDLTTGDTVLTVLYDPEKHLDITFLD